MGQIPDAKGTTSVQRPAAAKEVHTMSILVYTWIRCGYSAVMAAIIWSDRESEIEREEKEYKMRQLKSKGGEKMTCVCGYVGN